ncbi:hypothetical protein [Streptomyces sp. Mo3]|uniref:hypothetical protein n=1 Tax=Streptomyces sp. Mo3 TaxID=3161190 RepID=UPI0039F0C15D
MRASDWNALTCWPGSYLTIARSGESLAVIGDLAGQHPVYWRAEATGTWWSTSAAALAALDGAPFDPAVLAAHLALAQPDVLGQRSLFRAVSRVPTGHLLLVTPDGANTVRYEPVNYQPLNLPDAAPRVRAEGNPYLTMAGLRPDLWAPGHSTPATAAVIQQDGVIVADHRDSPSLTVLRAWLAEWESAGRPAPEVHPPLLARREDGQGPVGWDLRLAGAPETCAGP